MRVLSGRRTCVASGRSLNAWTSLLVFRAAVGFPGTAYYDREGRLVYTRQGQYPSEAALAADIRRYTR